MITGDNRQDAMVLSAPPRPVHKAERSRFAMPTVHPSKARRGNEVPIVLTAVQVDRFWQFVEESENATDSTEPMASTYELTACLTPCSLVLFLTP
jgi:hypothetical protein